MVSIKSTDHYTDVGKRPHQTHPAYRHIRPQPSLFGSHVKLSVQKFP